MGKINMIIKDLKSLHKGPNRPWIYDENGKMKDNINYIDVYELIRDGTILPKKHGRLIDGDVVCTEWEISHAPTLVDPTPDFL